MALADKADSAGRALAQRRRHGPPAQSRGSRGVITPRLGKTAPLH